MRLTSGKEKGPVAAKLPALSSRQEGEKRLSNNAAAAGALDGLAGCSDTGRSGFHNRRATLMKQLAIILLVSAAACQAQDQKKADQKIDFKKLAREGWVNMFDGKTMKGWKVNEAPESWKVVDGTLRCQGKRSHLFFVGKDGKAAFKNFEFRCQVKTQKGANAGIYFHTKFQPTGWPKYGYECQVNITQQDTKKTSSLYGVKNVSADDLKGLIKDDEWYWQTIVVKDNHITLKVNDKTMVEFDEEKDRKAFSGSFERRLGTGTIAFQAHDPGSVAQFRNIMIRELK